MKVALIHYRLLLRGGLETRLFNYINYFLNRKDEVTVIVTKKARKVALPAGVKVVILPSFFLPKAFRHRFFNYRLGKYLANNSFDFTLSLGRTSHQDMVLAPGNHLGFLQAMPKMYLRQRDKMQIYLDNLSFQKSKIIFAASDMIKEEIINLYNIESAKIKILHPPLNTDRFYQDNTINRSELRKQFGMNPHKKSFVFVSTGHGRKGLPLLLKLFEALQEEPYELFIAGHPRVLTTLKNVTFVGFQQEPRELYLAADYMILPAKYEPFGQVVTEALQCGTPVLLSPMVGAKEIVTEDIGIVVPSFEEKDWLEAIRSLKNRQFTIEENFAEAKQLTLQHHMDFMLKAWEAL